MGQRNGCPACCADEEFDECEDDDRPFIDEQGIAWHPSCLERVLAPLRDMWDAGHFDRAHDAMRKLALAGGGKFHIVEGILAYSATISAGPRILDAREFGAVESAEKWAFIRATAFKTPDQILICKRIPPAHSRGTLEFFRVEIVKAWTPAGTTSPECCPRCGGDEIAGDCDGDIICMNCGVIDSGHWMPLAKELARIGWTETNV